MALTGNCEFLSFVFNNIQASFVQKRPREVQGGPASRDFRTLGDIGRAEIVKNVAGFGFVFGLGAEF